MSVVAKLGLMTATRQTGESASMPTTIIEPGEIESLNEEVRGYFRECIRFCSIRRVLRIVEGAEVKLNQKTETIRKHHSNGADLSDHDDLVALKTFFTIHPEGLRLRGMAVTAVSQPQSTVTPNEAVRIGPGARERPIAPTELASISIAGLQWGAGTVSIEVGLHCGIIKGFALQRGMIALDPHPGAMMRNHRNAWNADRVHASNIKGRESSVVLRCYKSELNPTWEVDGLGQPIGNLTYAEIANLEGLSPGDVVMVTFSSWLPDLSHVDSVGSSGYPETNISEDDDLVRVDIDGKSATEISEIKRRVIWMIHQDETVKVTGRGRVELASHALNIAQEAIGVLRK